MNRLKDAARWGGRRGRGREGFTLTEVVISSGLVALTLSGIWGMIAWMAYSVYLTEARAEAVSVAASRLEQLDGVAPTTGSQSVGRYLARWTVTDPSAGNRQIEVTVSWTDARGRSNSVTLRSGSVVPSPGYSSGGSFASIFGGLP